MDEFKAQNAYQVACLYNGYAQTLNGFKVLCIWCMYVPLQNVLYGRRNKKCEGGRRIFLEGWAVVVCIVFNYQQDKSLLDEDNTDEDTE